MQRFYCLTIFSLFISTSSIASEHACDDLLSHHFGVSPSSIQWTKQIEEPCETTSQGRLGSCWTNSGRELFTQFFRSKKLLNENEELSLDYYFAKHIESQLERGISLQDIEEGGDLPDLARLILENGIVTHEQYEFPHWNGKTIREIWGTGEFKKQIRMKSNRWIQSVYLKSSHVKPKYIVRKSDLPRMQHQVKSQTNHMKILRTIKDQIDQNKLVFSGWIIDESTLRLFGNKGELLPNVLRPQKGQIHAVLITGYKLDSNGTISHLLIKNTFGKDFAENGHMAVDRYFFDEYFYDLYY